MDDIGCGVETFEQMVPTFGQIFECLRKSGFRLTRHKCKFGMTSTNFLGNTITPKGLKPEIEKIEKFLNTMKLPVTVCQVKGLVGFVLFFRTFTPNLAQNLKLWYTLLREDVEIALKDEKKDLLQATQTTLRLAEPGQRYVILRDANYYSSGFVLMIEDYLYQKSGTEKQAYDQSRLVLNFLIQVNSKCQNTVKKVLHFTLL